MHVRRFAADDADDAEAIFAAVAEEGRWILTEPPVDVARVAVRFRGSTEPMWVLDDESGGVVGMLGLHQFPRAPGVMTLGMNLVGDRRGRGGGSMLLQAALDWAREHGVHKLELEVYPENT